MIYYIIFFSLFIFAMIFDYFKVKQKYFDHIIYWLFGGVIFCLAAFRFETGYDFIPYQNMFLKVQSSSLNIFELSNNMNIEIGFVFLMKIFKGFSFEFFLFFVTLIAVLPKFVFIYKINKNKFLMLFCYYATIFLTYDMGIIRQGLSMSILLFSVKYLFSHNYIKFQFIVILASLFHSTSLIFSFLFLLRDKELSLKTYLILTALALIFPIFVNTSKFIDIISQFGGIIGTKSDYYANYYIESNIYISLIKRIIVMIIFLYFSKIKNNKNNYYDNLYWLSINAYILSLIMMSLLNGVAIIATRGTVSLYLFQIICFGYIARKNDNFQYLIVNLICLFLFYSSFIGPLKDQYSFYIPYETWILHNNY